MYVTDFARFAPSEVDAILDAGKSRADSKRCMEYRGSIQRRFAIDKRVIDKNSFARKSARNRF
jgi:hypothetical protein